MFHQKDPNGRGCGGGITIEDAIGSNMTKKDKEQSKRFIEKAKELKTDESNKAFEDAFKKIVPPVRNASVSQDRKQSK